MKFHTTDADAGTRLDIYLSKMVSSLSRSRIQGLIKDGHITVDGRKARAHMIIHCGLNIHVEVPPPRPAKLVPEDIPLDILYEDPDIIVINKPAGLVVHPAAGRYSGTLANALLYHCTDLAGVGGELRPGIVHRLDRDTTGTMVAAKNETAMRDLGRQFRNRTVRKEYLAAVLDVPSLPKGRIETLIGRSKHDRKKMAVRKITNEEEKSTPSPAGRYAATTYEIAEAFQGASLLRLLIETGRTHQIRVHLAYISHPVIGDPQYGGRRRSERLKELEEKVGPLPDVHRQMLHAEKLTFVHPACGKEMTFISPLHDDMAALLTALRGEGQ